jgi:PAS domain S-box-containing protein
VDTANNSPLRNAATGSEPAPFVASLDELLGRIAEMTDDVILITDTELIDEPGPRIVYVNPAFTRMTGYSSEEVIGLTPRVLQGRKTCPITRARIRDALQQWQPIRCELLNYRKDGSEFWSELSITPVADHSGLYRYWVAVQRDVSQKDFRVQVPRGVG